MSRPDYLRYFPYERPYPHQREAMERIHESLEAGSDILFEGATGTGKTLASLVPALEYGRKTGKTVVITTNVHQQMRQFRRDASAIAETEDIRAVVFRGKASMCHIDVGYEECQALRETTRDLVETEQELAELERDQRNLLEESQAGSEGATEARSAVMDELDAVEDELAGFESQATCDHYYRNLVGDTTDFFAWLYDDVRTPDDIYDYAHEEGFCGYELLKEGMEGVDLVVCNYHHLLDPMIREQFFRWLGRDPEDVIAIFDEAHNVESAARDHARRTLTENTIESALDELGGVDDPRAGNAINVIETYLSALRSAYDDALEFGERERVEEHWHDLAIDNDDRRDDLTLAFLQSYSGPGFEEELTQAVELGRELDTQYERAYKNGEASVRKECQTLQAATFIESWLDESAAMGTYPVVSVRRPQNEQETGDSETEQAIEHESEDEKEDESRGNDSQQQLQVTEIPDTKETTAKATAGGDIYGRAELYTCIPEEVTRTLFDDLHMSVLMSATIRPFDVTEDVLGLEEPETMAYGAQFPEERRRTYAVDGPALFASKRSEYEVQETITQTLTDAIRMTPGNTLVFFPSYAEAQRYYDRVPVGTAYLDQPGTAAHELREEFTSDENGVLYTSLWGTLGEGVSYDGDDARTVIVVGVPYPHLDERMEAVQDAYNAVFGTDDERREAATNPHKDDAGWRYAVEIPTIRKTRQALGRVVRSPDDFGVRVLLDARYTERSQIELPEYSVRSAFPPEERAEMVDIDPEKLKFGLLNFYGDMGAYDGGPPEP